MVLASSFLFHENNSRQKAMEQEEKERLDSLKDNK
jgi:hypothetical protein